MVSLSEEEIWTNINIGRLSGEHEGPSTSQGEKPETGTFLTALGRNQHLLAP